MIKSNIKVTTVGILFFFASCSATSKDLVKQNFDFAAGQLAYASECIEAARQSETSDNSKNILFSPRTLKPDGTLSIVGSRDWTCGFFPGELWYMYEFTADPKWKTLAQKYTAPIEREKSNGGTHDVGFKVYCSFGNGYRLTRDTSYRDIMLESAYTLTTRYNPKAGVIRSWDHNTDKWGFPVIIDNMMNLELLFWAFRQSGDSTLYNIAVSHADNTLKNHFRPDFGTYHVIDYDPHTGEVVKRNTHQGYAHESTWSRGEAWAIYGFTMCYRETRKQEYLEQAKHVADFIFSNPNLPADLIPYWDYNAPEIPDEPRDVSAATVTASALYELSTYVPEKSAQYKEWADTIIKNISTNYRAEPRTAQGFLLLHSVGSKPGKTEVDTPLSYADYYFLEALLRKRKVESGTPLFYY